ncbi:MAG: hypothetical protein LBV40_07090 [Methanomicrobiales archaeon]|nr:hypothetical protein [Methanomicrobiales archaeon]
MVRTKKLKRKNPFFLDVSPKPWEKNAYPNIPSIHLDSYAQVHELIAQKIKTPTKDIGIIFVGEKGCGKSHLLWRLCNDAQAADAPLFFASINPHIEPINPMRYLITEIAWNFSCEVDDFLGCTQFHRLIALIMQEFMRTEENAEELFQKTGFEESIFSLHADNAISFLLDENPKYHKKSLLFLFRCCDVKTRKKAFETLNTISEALAQELLLTLGLLISRYHHSLLISFDHLELINDNELRPFKKIILTVLGFSQGIIPFILTRTDEWNEISTKKMDTSVVQRFGNHITSTPCSDGDIEELVRARFQFMTDEDRKKKGYMWLISEVKKTLPNNPTPRQVLNTASKIFVSRNPTPRQVLNTTNKIFDPHLHKLAMSSVALMLAVYFEQKERKYETIRKCTYELELPDCDLMILNKEIPNLLPKVVSPGIVIRDMRKHTYFVELPFENIIMQFLTRKPGKTLRYIASILPMEKEEFCDCITRLYEQKMVAFMFQRKPNGPVLQVYPPNSIPVLLHDELLEDVIKLTEAMLHPLDMNIKDILKTFSKKTILDTMNYCIQENAISVHVFLHNHVVDSKLFIANEETLKAGYDALCQHGEYVMIHELRTYLNWSRNAFDSLLYNLERRGIIQLQAGDPGLLSTDEQKGMYVRQNLQRMLLFWKKA